MYSLFIDSHDKKVSIVLFKDGKVLDSIIEESNNKHSTIVMPSIDNIIKKSNIEVKDIKEILIVNGPGSFTGERIAVTIGKTMAYCLSVPIKVIDALTVLAINVDDEIKYVSVPDRNGAFVGSFDANNKQLDEFKYINKSEYEVLCNEHNVVSDIEINYDLVYDYFKTISAINPHEVKPLYIKGISALNGR